MKAAILNSPNFHSAILDFPLKLTHSCQDWFPLLAQKTFTHSFWLNLMMAAIFNSAILNSAILHKKNFTDSFWLSLMMAAILISAMLNSETVLSSLRFTQKHFPSTLTLTQTNSIWLTRWWQPSWILQCWIQPFCSNLWIQLIQSDSNSFIVTELDDGSHIEFCHLGFSHLYKKNFTHAFSLKLMMAAILKSALMDSAILHKKDLYSFILTQLDDGSHIEFCHLQSSHFGQKNFT